MNSINWSTVKVVSWDIDGTFYDLKAFMGALKKDLLVRAFTFRWFSLVRDVYRLVRFKRHMDWVRHHSPDFAVGNLAGRDHICETMEDIYARLLPDIGLLPGVVDLLDWIDSQGVTQIVFSDYRKSSKLKALGLNGRFEKVFAGEDRGHLKPSPTAFKAILDDLNVQPETFLHIGDRTDTDGAASESVGYQVAIIGSNFETASDLLALLRAQAADSSKN